MTDVLDEIAAIESLFGSGARDVAFQRLDAALVALHGSGRAEILSRLHGLAASELGAPEAVAFHNTHAYIYALEAGEDALAAGFHAALQKEGRI